MARVREAGFDKENSHHLFDQLDNEIIAGITGALIPVCRTRNASYLLDFCKVGLEDTVYDLVKGMKPWLAFLGAPHLKGMNHPLLADGYQVQGPWVPQ